MTPTTLRAALGGIINIPQFFVWRLLWDADEGKYHKQPCDDISVPWPIDASLPRNWLSFDDAMARVLQFRAADAHAHYTLGWYLSADSGYWFLDVDKCYHNGQYTPIAQEWFQALPGCFSELSSSGNGLHVIGRGPVPRHATKTKGPLRGVGELYSGKRGIAFSMSDVAYGCADVAGPRIADIAATYFPYVEADEGDWSRPRSDWNGPTDDEELIAKARASASVAARFGHKATFEQLWTNAPELEQWFGPDDRTERDGALSAHLAFWTGCDAPRMERLMWRSGLVRDKWHQHRTYLAITCRSACAKQKDVYQRRDAAASMYQMRPLAPLPLVPLGVASVTVTAEAPAVLAPAISQEVADTIERLLDTIHSCPDWVTMHNQVIPTVRAAGVPLALMPRIESAVNKRLELWDAKMRVPQLRALLNPPRAGAEPGSEVAVTRPDWAANYVYVRQLDAFHQLHEGVSMTPTSFRATHDRDMPIKGDGPLREDSAQWMLQHWQCPLVHDVMYWPGKPSIVDYDGHRWANTYVESSHPELPPALSDRAVRAIEKFKRHVWELCGRREAVYLNLIGFLAHNVQRPGEKITWAPIIKGVEGDGKSMIGRVMRAAMGERNVSPVGPEIIAAAGGFTDWAHGAALIVMEEIYLPGKDRWKITNSMKSFVSNDVVMIHPKGGKPKKVVNTSNQLAFTNHNDSIPIESDKDRRYFIIFTPFDTIDDYYRAMGFADERAAWLHFNDVFDCLREEPGAWRRWLMEPGLVPEWFVAKGRALNTAEKASMAASGRDDIEELVRGIIEQGTYGVSHAILSSACLSNAMKTLSMTEGVDVPKGQSLHHMLNRIGYVKVEKNLKWQQKAHRVWVRPGTATDPENLRKLLDMTGSGSAQVDPL